jgi:hypothetical protein
MGARIEQRGEDLVLVGCHDKPIAKVEAEGIRIHSKHGSDKCRPLLTWAEIEQARRDYFARLQ